MHGGDLSHGMHMKAPTWMGNGRHATISRTFGIGLSILLTLSLTLQPLDIPIGSVIEVTIRDLREYGFIVELAPGVQCLLHIHQFSHDFVSLHDHDFYVAVGCL
jgi:hypothetical protein